MLYRTDDKAISAEILETLTCVDYVVGYNQESNMLVQPVNFDNAIAEDTSNIFSIPQSEMVRLFADTDTSLNLSYSNNMELIEGRLPSSDDSGAIIDEVLSIKNNIAVGDVIVVKSQKSGMDISITVVGVYKSLVLPQESWTETNGNIAYGQSPYSYIFCDFQTYEYVAERDFPLSSVVIYADSMRNLRKVNSLLSNMNLPEDVYCLSNRTETKLDIGTSAYRAISSTATLLTSVSVCTSALILFMVTILWVRACYKDISILIALGESRCAIIRDYFFIITIITILALLLSLPFCNLVMDKFSSSLISYTFAASGNLSGLGIDNYMTFALNQPLHIVDYAKSDLVFLLIEWGAMLVASIDILRCKVTKLFAAS